MNITRRAIKEKGFTLIELLVVIAIIGLLSAIIVASLNTSRLKATDAKRISELHQIRMALGLYYNDNGNYPRGSFDSQTSSQWNTFSSYLTPTYMSKVPVDPKNKVVIEGSNNAARYQYYYYSAHGRQFIISAYLAMNNAFETTSNQYAPYYSITANCILTTSSTFYRCD